MASWTSAVYACALYLLFIEGYDSIRITSPREHERINPEVGSFLCNTDVAIHKCQFRLRNIGTRDNLTVIDSSSLNDTWKNFDEGFEAKNFSTNLSAGFCSASFRSLNGTRYVVGCRVREQKGDWIYKYHTLFSTKHEGVASYIQIDPKEEVFKMEGHDVNITCSASSGNLNCKFPYNTNLTHEYKLENKCGATLRVPQDDNRLIWCDEHHDDKFINSIGAFVTPIKTPPTPQLTLNNTDDKFVATCLVNGSRPAANISWFIDDVPVNDQQYDIQEIAINRWRWSWTPVFKEQRLSMNVTADVFGKKIKCSASHFALPEPLNSTEVTIQHQATTATISERARISAAPGMSTGTTTMSIPDIDSYFTSGKQAGNGDSNMQNVIVGAAVAGTLLIGIVAIFVFSRIKKRLCFAEKNSPEHTIAFAATNPERATTDQSQPDLVVYAQVQPRDQRKNQSEPAKSSSSQSQAENISREQRKNQSEPATSSSSQSQAENAVYAQVVPRDQRNQAERVNPDHVVYAEIVSSEPARRTDKMAPQEPEVTYTEVEFKAREQS